MTVTMDDIDGIVRWIKEYFSGAGRDMAVIGLSGGVDSAVTATLCARALGERNLVLVTLPSPDEDYAASQEDIRLANLIAGRLWSIPEKHYIQQHVSAIYHATVGDWTEDKMLCANIKARIRMVYLYAIAERVKGLVVGTTNKTEMILGYMTKYGDSGVDLEPTADFYKTEIFEMAQLLEIPQEIIDRPPSAGLWPGQTDEEELGFTYKEIDTFLTHREHNWAQEINTALASRVEQLEQQNKHKDMELPHYCRTVDGPNTRRFRL